VDNEGRKQGRTVTGEIKMFRILIGDSTARGKIVIGNNTTRGKIVIGNNA
jgi:hypothetical protein